jgi:hypothetical protein
LGTKLNTNKNFLQEVASSQISEVQNANESSSDELHLPEMQPKPKGPEQDNPHRHSRNFRKHKLKINSCWWGEEVVSCRAV